MAALQFVGGDVVETPVPTVEDLKQSARSWSAMMQINKDDADRLLDADDLIRADQWFSFVEDNVAKVRREIADALTMRGGK